MSYRVQRRLGQALLVLVLSIGAVFVILPFVYMISTSLKGQVYVFEFPPRFIPSQPTLNNFASAWQSNNFGRYFLNSLLVALSTTVLELFLSSTVAYAFARFEFPGKNVLYYTLLATLMVPGMMLIIPQFMLASRLKLLDSLISLILVYTAGGIVFNTFLLRGFFEQLPRELEEAALIDGGTPFTIFFRILLPLSTPALATVGIFTFLGAWDEYVWALTTINDPLKRTLPIAIANFHGTHASDWGLVFAGSLIAIVPVLIVFVLLQKYFIKGLTAGAIKG
ncbi:MAG: carbohydrate ABC transporter permease [Chloroflexota bacterium]|nr:carbohydrate ABC transporter permease [Chloroflexota bacterium]